MKTINLPALTQINFDEISEFLSWLEKQPNGETSLAQMQKTPPLRSSKINPMINILEHFGFLAQKQGKIPIQAGGRIFLFANTATRKSLVQTFFKQMDWIKKTLDLLQTSPNGRIHRNAISESYNSVSKVPIAESEVVALIAWAEACGLFSYDRKRRELVRVESLTPYDPRPTSPNLSLAS